MSKMEKIDFVLVSSYNGHNVKANGIVEINFKTKDLVDSVNLFQLINNDIEIYVKKSSEKAFKVGLFRFDSHHVGNDGEVKYKLKSTNDHTEMDTLNRLLTDEMFKVRCISEVELEDDEEEQDE